MDTEHGTEELRAVCKINPVNSFSAIFGGTIMRRSECGLRRPVTWWRRRVGSVGDAHDSLTHNIDAFCTRQGEKTIEYKIL